MSILSVEGIRVCKYGIHSEEEANITPSGPGS